MHRACVSAPCGAGPVDVDERHAGRNRDCSKEKGKTSTNRKRLYTTYYYKTEDKGFTFFTIIPHILIRRIYEYEIEQSNK